MRKCEECGKLSVEFAFDTGQMEVWECKYCGARYEYNPEFGELQRISGM
jgi:ribosomal protein L37AE/L43A